MKTIRDLYKIGPGPSSSHTIGPSRAATWVKEHHPSDRYVVKLFASLAATGKGHMTDYAIEEALSPSQVDIFWYPNVELPKHPNGMIISVDDTEYEIYSVGGGSIEIIGHLTEEIPEVYPEKNFKEIRKWCDDNNKRLCEYVYHYEGEEIKLFLDDIWRTMEAAIERGLVAEGELDGGLQVTRKAKDMFARAQRKELFRREDARENALVMSYAFAVNEENASGNPVVTAPTCGASGVVPAVLKFLKECRQLTHEEIIDCLATAAVFGNVVKHNASISGAQGGCQAEVGTACAMGAAAFASSKDFPIEQIERAAEIALEHHLGLTCDPVLGLVQIPCIERNAVASLRAIDASDLAEALPTSRVAFDMVVKTMYETGLDMDRNYRETSQGGLAKNF